MTATSRRWSFSLRTLFVMEIVASLFFALAVYNPYAAMAVVMWLAIPALIVGVLVSGRFAIQRIHLCVKWIWRRRRLIR